MAKITNFRATNTLSRDLQVPTNLLRSGKISSTSNAQLCMTQQRFSAKLQIFLINYVAAVSSHHSVKA